MKSAVIENVENFPHRGGASVGAFAHPPRDTVIDVTELEWPPVSTPWRELCTEIDALAAHARVLDGFDEIERLDDDYRALRYLN